MRIDSAQSRATGRPRRAFTMIELLVVIGVVIMLLGILIVAVAGASRTAQATNTRALMNSMKQALIQFRQDIGYLPPVLGDPTPDTSLPPSNSDMRRLFPPANVVPEYDDLSLNLSYDVDIQEWFSWTTLAEYLLGYGGRDYDGYGIDSLGNYSEEQPPLGLRNPGSDGVWGATIYGAADGTLAARMLGPVGAEFNVAASAGKVYGPYLQLKDANLLASTDGSVDSTGRLNLIFPGSPGYHPDLPKVVLDYWGHPIRYYRRLYAPGSLQSEYRIFGSGTRPPTLSDVFVLRPFELNPANSIDALDPRNSAQALGDRSQLYPAGDPSTSMALSSAEFALFSSGPDGLLNPDLRHDSPDDLGNDPYGTGPTSFANEDNIVELGP